MGNTKRLEKREEGTTYVRVVGGKEEIREFEEVKEARKMLSRFSEKINTESGI